MSETNHTPGPWSVVVDGIDVGPKEAFMPFGGCGCCGSPWIETRIDSRYGPEHDAEELANARLIAAAPDLLAELLHIVSMIDSEGAALPDPLSCAAEMAREAIRKATGGDDA